MLCMSIGTDKKQTIWEKVIPFKFVFWANKQKRASRNFRNDRETSDTIVLWNLT